MNNATGPSDQIKTFKSYAQMSSLLLHFKIEFINLINANTGPLVLYFQMPVKIQLYTFNK